MAAERNAMLTGVIRSATLMHTLQIFQRELILLSPGNGISAMAQHPHFKILFIPICNQAIITYALRLKLLRMELLPVPILIVSRSMQGITTRVVRRTSACILTAQVWDSNSRIFPPELRVQQI